MKKIIKKIGNSIAVIFNLEEQKIYGIESGKVYDIEISKVKSKNKGEREWLL